MNLEKTVTMRCLASFRVQVVPNFHGRITAQSRPIENRNFFSLF